MADDIVAMNEVAVKRRKWRFDNGYDELLFSWEKKGVIFSASSRSLSLPLPSSSAG